MKIRDIAMILLVITLSACVPAAQASPIVESTPPTVKPTVIQLTVTLPVEPEVTPSFTPTIDLSTDIPTIPVVEVGNVNTTVLHFDFPFEPSIGYTVDITSETLTTNLLCALGGQSTGDAIEMGDNSNNPKKWGTCDKSSMTLDIGIPDQMTVTVILGGIPFINQETKSPSQITEQQIEYTFEVNLQ